MTSTPTACPSCEREQFIGKCPHNREPYPGNDFAYSVSKPRQPATPTACPDCNNCGLPCLNEIHHPRQPDDRERAIRHYTASIVGEYVAGQVRRDFIAGADWGHARALKEMGAEVNRLKIALDQKEFTLQNTFNQWQERCEQLAAAQAEIDRLKNTIKIYEIQLSAGGFV